MASPLESLVGQGAPFEIVVEDVCGVPLQVYKQRFSSMRDLLAIGDARPELDWIVQGERRLTFGAHNALVRRTAAGMLERGVKQGDRVAVVSANTMEWVVMFWACAAIGAACVPLNAWWKSEELEFALNDSGAVLLYCDVKRWAVVRDIVSGLSDLANVYVMGIDAADGIAQPDSALLASGDVDSLPKVDVAEDDLLAILYTSGTTGKPKGATITHRQALANLQNLSLLNAAAALIAAQATPAQADPDPTPAQAANLLVVPLFHVTGALATMVPGYAGGAKLVLMPPGQFDPDEAMATIEREKITSIGGVPTVMWRIVEADNFEKFDLSSVLRIGYGGAPAAPELVEKINIAFPQVRKTLSTAYGLTETASVATVNIGEDYFSHPGSVGRVVPTVEAMIIDEDGNALPAGETGEIALRGPTIMMRGYWNRPDATEAAFLPAGWFRSGDIGHIDPDGFIYLSDRAKDMIIRAGENVYCVEIENVLFEHPHVLDAAVVGVAHRTLGEEVKAVVQLRVGSTTTVDDLRKYCGERLSWFKVPEYIDILEVPLPRNPAGKVLKNLLRGDTAGSAFAPSPDDDSAL